MIGFSLNLELLFCICLKDLSGQQVFEMSDQAYGLVIIFLDFVRGKQRFAEPRHLSQRTFEAAA